MENTQPPTMLVMENLGCRVWHRNGVVHREDGPAIEFTYGGKEWWLEGVRYAYMVFRMPENHIVLEVEDHPKYPKVKIWKILGKDSIYEEYIFPGMLDQE